jgi:hypothetical protein
VTDADLLSDFECVFEIDAWDFFKGNRPPYRLKWSIFLTTSEPRRHRMFRFSGPNFLSREMKFLLFTRCNTSAHNTSKHQHSETSTQRNINTSP